MRRISYQLPIFPVLADHIGMNEYLFPIILTDFLFNTNAPSHLGERLFKQILFHGLFTFLCRC